MKKVSFMVFGTIFGAMALGGDANASIISRSFLDEALTDYATNTAYQRDFSALYSEISDGVQNLKNYSLNGASYEFSHDMNPDKFRNNILGASSFLGTYLDLLASSFINGWKNSDGVFRPGLIALKDGWADNYDKHYGLLWPGRANYQTATELFGLTDDYLKEYPRGATVTDVLYNMLWPQGSDWGAYLPTFLNMESRIFFGGYVNSQENIDKYGLKEYKGLFDLNIEYDALKNNYSNIERTITVMKTVSEEKNLPSTSDDGQYVLTAKKVGDKITYTWVKMDLTSEEQAQ